MARRKKTPVSRGKRLRLGRPVQDADIPISMYLTSVDLRRARRKRRGYEVNDPQNFSQCALATCLSRLAGADALVTHRFAFVALPGETHTLRFMLDAETSRIVELNDLDKLDEVQANTPINFLPPTPGRRLNHQRGPRVSKKNRGLRENPSRPRKGISFEGKYRNGVHVEHHGD